MRSGPTPAPLANGPASLAPAGAPRPVQAGALPPLRTPGPLVGAGPGPGVRPGLVPAPFPGSVRPLGAPGPPGGPSGQPPGQAPLVPPGVTAPGRVLSVHRSEPFHKTLTLYTIVARGPGNPGKHGIYQYVLYSTQFDGSCGRPRPCAHLGTEVYGVITSRK